MQKTINASLRSILDSLPDAIIWVYPVFGADGTIYDFKVGFSNRTADDEIGHPKGSLTGLHILEDGIPGRSNAEANFQHLLEVFQTGETKEVSFYVQELNRFYELRRCMLDGGILSTARDRAAQREAERKEQKISRTFKSIVENSPAGVLVYDSVRNAEGNIIDFRIRHFNQKSNELSGFSESERINFGFRQILAQVGAEHVFDAYVEVVNTGIPLQREQYLKKPNKWISSSIVKLDDGFLAMLTDITAFKESQNTLQYQSAYFERILNASLNAVVTMEAVRDKKGMIIDMAYRQVNNTFLQWFEKSAQDVIHHRILELFPNIRGTGIFDIYCEVIETGMPRRVEIPYQSEEKKQWYDLSVVRLDENTVVASFNDITEARNSLEQIEQQKNLLDNIMRHSSNGISVTEVIRNKEGKVIDARTVLANDAAVKFTGLDRDTYLTKTATEIDPGILDSPYGQMYTRALETGEPFLIQYYLELTGRWLELSVSRMDKDHMIHIFTDVTTVKEGQLQQEKLLEELKRSNASLEEFAYAASHDLQEPLRKIHTFSERLKTDLFGQSNTSQQRMFERMESATERMKNLIEDLLAYSQVSGKSIELKRIHLNEVVQQVLHDLEASIMETEARLSIDPLPEIDGDERQLRQMFQNLIGNAIKYRKPDVRPEVIVSCRQLKDKEVPFLTASQAPRKDYFLIEVADNGIGFEQEYSEKIFQVFQRLHGRSEYEGSGVGLAIVQKVVNNHNGFISAESEPGKGAKFCVYLPA